MLDKILKVMAIVTMMTMIGSISWSRLEKQKKFTKAWLTTEEVGGT